MELSLLARVLRAAADECDRIASEERAERRDWTDQHSSPLGRRRHVARVRARIQAGAAGAAMVGRRALLSAEALADEIEALGRRKPTEPSFGDELRRELRLAEGSR